MIDWSFVVYSLGSAAAGLTGYALGRRRARLEAREVVYRFCFEALDLNGPCPMCQHRGAYRAALERLEPRKGQQLQ